MTAPQPDGLAIQILPGLRRRSGLPTRGSLNFPQRAQNCCLKASPIWIPGGLLLATLLLRPQREWASPVTGTIVGGWIGLMPLGRPYGYALAGFLLICPVIALVAKTLKPTLPALFTDGRAFARFFLLAVVALPAYSGLVTACILYAAGKRAAVISTWLTVAPSHAMSFLLVTPLILTVAAYRRPSDRSIRPMSVEAALLAVAILTVSVGLWSIVPHSPTALPLLLFAPLPLLLLAALRFGALGSAVGLFLVATPAAALSIYSGRPFDGGQSDVHLMQIWLLGVGLLVYMLAILSDQQRIAQNHLAASQGQIRYLATRLLQEQETERARIARDLHDGVNQHLALLAIQASRFIKTHDHPTPSGMPDFQSLIATTTEEVRRISHNLHPAILEHTGLVPALQSLVDDMASAWKGENRFVCDAASGRPDYATSLCLYRVAQEGLGNAIRHARAQRIVLDLTRSATRYQLLIQDDGQGFNPDAIGTAPGLGLISMQERVRLAGGSLTIRTALGEGTELWIEMPSTV
ncbi:MASE1 domain-containing protein [Kaistia terrae]|uniref:Oxygen sensor histidine kinase NreB n=1 Tax=Kaistia terrae TaxID=537017 RepID=A0ABW0PZF1_9HYPH|nr:MASE1 domain-containing protein [Kaistia terrae]MCX5581664.1 MASE1 domain-containing protein [Kaistia terrae]